MRPSIHLDHPQAHGELGTMTLPDEDDPFALIRTGPEPEDARDALLAVTAGRSPGERRMGTLPPLALDALRTLDDL